MIFKKIEEAEATLAVEIKLRGLGVSRPSYIIGSSSHFNKRIKLFSKREPILDKECQTELHIVLRLEIGTDIGLTDELQQPLGFPPQLLDQGSDVKPKRNPKGINSKVFSLSKSPFP
jgi:hypothetical protein